MNRSWAILAAVLLAGGCQRAADPADWVDPFIGSAGHGHVFVGASVPWGLVQLGPTNQQLGWDWCSGYHASDSVIIGFSHTHLSGTGMPELCDITVMPVVGEGFAYARGTASDPSSGPFSTFSHGTEQCVPGYYSVRLDRYGILAELTATQRTGMHRYSFPSSDEAAIVFDLENGSLNERLTGWHIEAVGDTVLRGYRRSSVWADRGFSVQDGQQVYFEAAFSRPFRQFRRFGGGRYGRVDFRTAEGEQVLVKVGLSLHSCEAAARNRAEEIPGWDFDLVRRRAREAWNDQLSRLEIRSDDPQERRVFYSALYHSMIYPNIISDAAQEEEQWSNFSFWDTYRAQMPFYALVFPDVFDRMVRSVLRTARRTGKVPVWPMMGIETDCMIGNPGIPVLADGVLKGFLRGADAEDAYAALRRSALLDERWQGLRKAYGYIPCDIEPDQSVAYECEYALADASVAQVARRLGKEDDYAFFLERSHSWTRLFDPATGLIRPKDRNGRWKEPFDPLNVDFGNGYCEGNAWQYRFLVPHDVDTLAALLGSARALEERLDSLFSMPSDLVGHSSDMTGMIGQYVHGNEPGHHIIWLYSVLGRGQKCSALTHRVLRDLYTAAPDGLCGNEDMGQMSAWYLLSAMGLYQVEPSGGRYYTAAPLFDRVTVRLPDGRSFTRTPACDRPYLDYPELAGGGTF